MLLNINQMKRVLIIFALLTLIFSSGLRAQSHSFKNIIAVQPLKSIHFRNVTYQRRLNERLSLGGSGGVYQYFSLNDRLENFRIDPYLKVYFFVIETQSD